MNLYGDDLPGQGRTYAHEVGWRFWFVRERDSLLTSVLKGKEAWPPDCGMEARCQDIGLSSKLVTDHKSPGKPGVCHCGFHAVRTFDTLFRYNTFLVLPEALTEVNDERNPLPVYGRVALWGETFEHEGGFRSRYAFPLSLSPVRMDLPDPPLVERARALYKVPGEEAGKKDLIEVLMRAFEAYSDLFTSEIPERWRLVNPFASE